MLPLAKRRLGADFLGEFLPGAFPGSSVRLPQSNDESGEDHKADHPVNVRSRILQREGTGRGQEPVPYSQ
jgi:hypothetical protein